MSHPSIRRSVFARIFLMWLLCLGMAAQLPGQSQTPARPKGTDTRFVDFIGTENRWGQACSSPGHPAYPVQSFDLPITRVVGSDNAINADGYLADPDKAIQNGVISKYAELKVRIWEDTWDETRYRPLQFLFGKVRINGTVLNGVSGLLRSTGSNGWTRDITLWFPSRLLKFPARKPPIAPYNAEASRRRWVFRDPPEPRINRIEFLANTAALFPDESGTRPMCGPEIHEWNFYPMSLSFDAMAPTILIHGNNEEPRFFSTRASPKAFDFERELRQQMLPYSVDVFMATDSIADHGAALSSNLPSTVRSFGAQTFHVVAHSKGGLDTREFLARLRGQTSPQIAPYSLTTLSTPHRGSPGADYMQHAIEGVTAVAGNNALSAARLLAAYYAVKDYVEPQRRANRDLTTSRADHFNDANLPLLPMALPLPDRPGPIKISYFTLSADANVDYSLGTYWNWLDAQEVDGLPADTITANIVYQMLGEVRRVRLGRLIVNGGGRLVEVVAAEEVPTSSFQLNDVAVPVWSGQGLAPFIHVRTVKKNHASIASPEVASEAAALARRAQPLKFQ